MGDNDEAPGPDSPKSGLREAGEEHDVSDGPIKARGCTDVWCFVIFLVHWIGFGAVTLAGMQDGNPSKLYSPRDYRGDYCGIEDNWQSNSDMSGFTKLIHMMNLTEFVDAPAKAFVCSTAAEAQLSITGVLTTAEMETYMCACCKLPCASCSGVSGLTDFSSASDAASKTSSMMRDLTDSSRAGDLFSVSGSNAGSFSNVYSQAKRYFYQVCTTSCDVATHNTSMREVIFSPAPDINWKFAWDKLATDVRVSAAMRTTLADSFKFNALPLSLCPYKAKYCVPLPGTGFSEIAPNYCSFQVSSEVVSALGATADTFKVEEISSAGYETLGSAFGDVMMSLDTFIVVSVVAFVNGFIFLVLLRFFISCIVWSSMFGVFVLFVGSGAALYVRSGQCSGTSFIDTGTNYGVSAATIADKKVNGVVVESDESISGNGANYRGKQARTRGARTCQAWSVQTPHSSTTYSSLTADEQIANGLVENYCRNPLGSIYIWCYTTDPDVRWELCDPLGVQPWEHSCPSGYAVADENMRNYLKICAYVVWGFSAIWILITCCLWNRIKLAVALNKVASTFLYHTPMIIIVPIIQAFIAILWNLFWAFCASFIMSQVADGYVPDGNYTSYDIAYGTTDTAGKCTSMWPQGYVWKYEGDATLTNDPCSGNLGDTSAITPACWRCSPPRYMLDVRFAYSFFSFLWANAFLIAIGQTIVAGACGVWFFAPHGEKSKVNAVSTGWRNVWRYHLGSLALGSFIIALVQFIRYCVAYLQKQAEAQKNRVMVLVFRCLGYLIWCFEKCLKFLTKNAFIQIALVGVNFCQAAKKAWQLIFRNAIRFGVFALLGGVINIMGIALIVTLTLFAGYYILMAMHSEVSPVVPMICFAMMAYVVAKLFMMVFHLACDSMMQCFILTEEMGLEKAKNFVPGDLRKLIPSTE